MPDLLHGAAQPPQGPAGSAPAEGFAAFLPYIFQKGQGEGQPPQAGKGKNEGQTGEHGHPHPVHDQKNQQRDGAAPQVPQAVTHGRDPVHPFIGGHIGKEAVIVEVRPGKAHRGKNVQPQNDPGHLIGQGRVGEIAEGRCPQQQAAQAAQGKKYPKQLFAQPGKIPKGPQHRRGQGHNGHGQAGGIAPGTHAGHRVLGVAGHRVEKDGQNGDHDHRMGAVGPVVEHPALFFLGKIFQQIQFGSPALFLPVFSFPFCLFRPYFDRFHLIHCKCSMERTKAQPQLFYIWPALSPAPGRKKEQAFLPVPEKRCQFCSLLPISQVTQAPSRASRMPTTNSTGRTTASASAE